MRWTLYKLILMRKLEELDAKPPYIRVLAEALNAGTGQTCRALRHLEAEGYLMSEQESAGSISPGGPRVYFRLSDKGRKAMTFVHEELARKGVVPRSEEKP